MIKLYNDSEFTKAKSGDKLPCKCEICGDIFYKSKRDILKGIRGRYGFNGKYCSKKCEGNDRMLRSNVTCDQCGISFIKKHSEIKRSSHNFCSHTCNAKYYQSHKSSGTRRSKLEQYIEQQLTNQYPQLEFHFNRTDAINAELDIYIPSLQLAFELNGIFHYEPIYGTAKLTQIQNNDQNKFTACKEKSISLCIIDTSAQKYFKIKSSQIYFSVITNIINQELRAVGEF